MKTTPSSRISFVDKTHFSECMKVSEESLRITASFGLRQRQCLFSTSLTLGSIHSVDNASEVEYLVVGGRSFLREERIQCCLLFHFEVFHFEVLNEATGNRRPQGEGMT